MQWNCAARWSSQAVSIKSTTRLSAVFSHTVIQTVIDWPHWLYDRTNRLIDWWIGWWSGGLAGCSIGWLAARYAIWLIDWLFDRLIASSLPWLSATDWNRCLSWYHLIDRHWLIDWQTVIDWLIEWVSEWMRDLVVDWLFDSLFDWLIDVQALMFDHSILPCVENWVEANCIVQQRSKSFSVDFMVSKMI